MNEKEFLICFLDSPTLKALSKIYDTSYSRLSHELLCTKENIAYHIHGDSFSKSQKMKLLSLFQEYGLETAELMLVHNMAKKKEKVTKLF
ncbi:hypothetical protein U9K47_16470 [Bacillus toyonensis]|uniref:hypothetical protein n=1 Tax=Bacillus cereus group TaxID=86661 RepID=UPI003467D7F6